MKWIEGIPVWGSPIDDGAFSQIKNCITSGAVYAALMADHHKGYAVPIGGVVAYIDAVSPSGVGYDIGCGNAAHLTDLVRDDLEADLPKIMDMVWKNISFGVGRKNNQEVFWEDYDSPIWRDLPYLASLREVGREQLGTVGSGNHYVDILLDEMDRVWVGVHFGSRGLGHKIATYFLNAGGASDGMDVDPLVISTKSILGRDYLEAMALAGRYAHAGREWVCNEIVRLLGAQTLDRVHNHHNFAWRETHFGQDVWVVRKGATPNKPGMLSFVGGSMGDNCYILRGVDSEESEISLYSTIHGAGRVMSRTAAKGKINRKTGEIIKPGLISKEMMFDWIGSREVVLRGAGTDEAPQAYKRINDVLEHHIQTVAIEHTLRPVGVAMAGENEFDPYKD